jgi:hypothetical protein
VGATWDCTVVLAAWFLRNGKNKKKAQKTLKINIGKNCHSYKIATAAR